MNPRIAAAAAIFILIGFPISLKAQGACQTHDDCPCGQGCDETGQCRNLAIPQCGGRIDPPCPRDDLFTGACFEGSCELSCACEIRCTNPPCACDDVARTIAATPRGGTVKLRGVVSTNARVEGQIIKGEGSERTIVRPRNPDLPVFTITDGSLVGMTISGRTSEGVAAIRGAALDSGGRTTILKDVSIRETSHGVDGSFAAVSAKDLAVSNTDIAMHFNSFGPAILKGIFIFDNQFGIMIFDDGTTFDPGIYEITGNGGECMHGNDFGNIYVKGTGFFSTEVHISDCFIDDGGGFGILLEEAHGVISNVTINSIDPNSNGFFGDGVSLLNAIATLSDSVISNSARAGVSVFCPDLPSAINISDSLFVDNAISLNEECDFFAAFQDGGGNVCMENGLTVACKTLSSSLTPPSP